MISIYLHVDYLINKYKCNTHYIEAQINGYSFIYCALVKMHTLLKN